MTGLFILALVPLLAAILFWLAALRERAARARAEAALRAARERTAGEDDARLRFLGIVGHELRSPLTAIMGYQELLADGIYGELGDDVMEALRRIGISARQLLALTDGMEELAGRKNVGDEGGLPFDPTDMLRESFATAAREAAARNIALSVELPDALPPLRADPDRLHGLIDLLLYGAIKLARGDHLRASAAADGTHVSLVLSGTGLARHPIPPDADTLSEAVFRITTGAALRLAIAHRIAHTLGGSLATAGTDADAALVLRLPSSRA